MDQSDPVGKSPGEPDSPLVAMGRYSGYGLQLAVTVGLFMAAGWWVDGKLGTKPLLTILGALGGGAAAFYRAYVQLTKREGSGR